MNLVGKFYNEAKKITITFNPDGSYTLTGLPGYNTEFGVYKFGGASHVAGYPDTIVLKHSNRLQDAISTGTLTLPVRFIDNNSFSAMNNDFCVENFHNQLEPAVFTRIK